jgi:hypothetical protein
MATFDRQAAKKAGWKDQQIDDYLAKMAQSTQTSPTTPKPTQEQGGGWGDFFNGVTQPFVRTGKNIASAAVLYPQAQVADIVGGFDPQKGAEIAGWDLFGTQSHGQDVVKDGKKAIVQQLKDSANIGSYAVPVGKTAGAVLKNGAITGGMQAISQDDATPGSVAAGAAGGAVVGGLLHGAGKVLTKGTRKGAETMMNKVFEEPTKKGTKIALKKGEELGTQVLDNGGGKGLTTKKIFENSKNSINTFEDALQERLGNSKRVVPISEIKEATKPILKKYAAAGNTTAAKNIIDRIAALEEYHGSNIPISTANEVKRTLYDELQNSYGQMATENKEGLKQVARALRESIAKRVPGADLINQEIKKHSRIADSMLEKMTKEERSKFLSLTDMAIGGGGYLAGGPAGLTALAGKKIVESTGGQKTIAQGLNTVSKIANKAGKYVSEPIKKAGQVAGSLAAESVVNSGNNGTNQEIPGGTNNEMDHTNSIPYNNEKVKEKSTLTGYTPEKIYSAYQKAVAKGDKKAAGELRQMYTDETAYQKSGGTKKAQTETQAAREQMVKLIQDLDTQFEAKKGKLGIVAPFKEGILSTIDKGDQDVLDFYNTASNLKATLAKARAGTSFTPNEEALLNQYTPHAGDSVQQLKTKIYGLKKLAQDSLQNDIVSDQAADTSFANSMFAQ